MENKTEKEFNSLVKTRIRVKLDVSKIVKFFKKVKLWKGSTK